MALALNISTTFLISADQSNPDQIGNAADLKINTGVDSKLAFVGMTKLFTARKVLTVASSIMDIDLTQLTDRWGNLIVWNAIYGFYFKNRDVSGASGLHIGGAASNPWTAPFNGQTTACLQLDSGGEIMLTTPNRGFPVTATSKVLRFQNDHSSPSGPAVTFDMYFWGK